MEEEVKILHPLVQRMEINFCLHKRNRRIYFFQEQLSLQEKLQKVTKLQGGDFHKELAYRIDQGFMDHRIIDIASGQIHLLHFTHKDNNPPKSEGACPEVHSH